MKQHERPLKALANKRRLEIIKFLKEKKEATVGDIASHLKLSFKSTSRHIAVLYGADILEKDQRSSSCFYSLAAKLPPVAKSVIALL